MFGSEKIAKLEEENRLLQEENRSATETIRTLERQLADAKQNENTALSQEELNRKNVIDLLLKSYEDEKQQVEADEKSKTLIDDLNEISEIKFDTPIERKLVDVLATLRFQGCVQQEACITDIAYDSRKAGKNVLFVCLKGAKADGHDYATAAYQAGSRIFEAQAE